jgi:hypothetical protein
MEIIKRYKTISILVALIIVFGTLAIFVKVFDVSRAKTNSEIKVSVTPIPTPEPFIHPESINIPSSYMGYAVTKTAQGDLSKSALIYGRRYVDLSGVEWIIKKNKVSDIEYSQIKPVLDSYVQGQLGKQGWASSATVNGQTITPNLPKMVDLSEGFIKVYKGQIQELILVGSKDTLGNVQLKLFVSKIYNLKDL